MDLYEELQQACASDARAGSIIIACQLFVPSSHFHDYGRRYEMLERSLEENDQAGIDRVLDEGPKSHGVPWFSAHDEYGGAVEFIKQIYEEALACRIHDGHMVTAPGGGNVFVSIWPDM